MVTDRKSYHVRAGPHPAMHKWNPVCALDVRLRVLWKTITKVSAFFTNRNTEVCADSASNTTRSVGVLSVVAGVSPVNALNGAFFFL
jgi:hypothetical protein